ncbi:MAG: GAF domain-containing sensor histidine kinase, partial [bacterium]
PREITRRGYIKRKGSIAEWVIEHGKPLLLNDDVKNRRYHSIAEGRHIRSSLCAPLQAKGETIGVLNIARLAPAKHFSEDDLETIVVLASQAAMSIENARLVEEQVKSARLAAVGMTVAGISHCIKNVLTGVRGAQSICELAVESKHWESLSSGLGILSRGVNRLSTIVLDMLDYARERKPVRQPTDIPKLLADAMENFLPLAEKKGVSFVLDTLPNTPLLPVDGDQLVRCFFNLIGNALDACAPKVGRVVVKCRYWIPPRGEGKGKKPSDTTGTDQQTDDGLHFRPPPHEGMFVAIIDNGEGIDEAHLDDIFLPFFSLKGSKGTGLGLPVTKKVVEEHGGTIWVESKKGDGTTFMIFLPCCKQSDDLQTAEQATPSQDASQSEKSPALL